MRNKKKTINVTAAIIEKDRKIFVARRRPGLHLAGYWEFPGGKIEKDESPKECLMRELQEELSIVSEIGAFIGESTYEYDTKIIRLMAYKVEHKAGKFKLIDHDKIKWLSYDELDQVKWAPADIPLVKQYKAEMSTVAYYDANAKKYCDETYKFKVDYLYKPFLNLLHEGAHILDLGCGSGRDSKYFIERGYNITAMDGSEKIAIYAEKNIGQHVNVLTFQQMKYKNEFDAVWACASLLHCSKAHITDVLNRILSALKPHGVAYISFKWGTQDAIDNKGRAFNNYTKDTLDSLLSSISMLTVIDLWTHTLPLRGSEQKWVNALIKKSDQL